MCLPLRLTSKYDRICISVNIFQTLWHTGVSRYGLMRPRRIATEDAVLVTLLRFMMRDAFDLAYPNLTMHLVRSTDGLLLKAYKLALGITSDNGLGVFSIFVTHEL